MFPTTEILSHCVHFHDHFLNKRRLVIRWINYAIQIHSRRLLHTTSDFLIRLSSSMNNKGKQRAGKQLEHFIHFFPLVPFARMIQFLQRKPKNFPWLPLLCPRPNRTGLNWSFRDTPGGQVSPTVGNTSQISIRKWYGFTLKSIHFLRFFALTH